MVFYKGSGLSCCGEVRRACEQVRRACEQARRACVQVKFNDPHKYVLNVYFVNEQGLPFFSSQIKRKTRQFQGIFVRIIIFYFDKFPNQFNS